MFYSSASKCLVVAGSDAFYKIPLTVAAHLQMREELTNVQAARQDAFWMNHVVPLEGCAFIARSKRMRDPAMPAHPALKAFIRRRKHYVAFARRQPLREAMNLATLEADVLPDCDASIVAMIDAFRDAREVPVASVHGDFHLGNIFVHGARLWLIDWANFRSVFWASYDLHHIAICRIADRRRQSWVDILPNLAPESLATEAGFPIVTDWADINCYALARSELECSQDKRLARLTDERLAKYRRALNDLTKRL